MPPPSLRLVGLALLAVLSMSLVPLLIRSTQANEITIGLVRLAIAVALVSPVVYFRRERGTLSPPDWRMLLVVGLVFGAHWLTYFFSIKMASAAIGAIAVSTYGIHLLLLNWLVARQRILPVEWAAVGLCFIGVILVAPSFDPGEAVTIGLMSGILSGFLYACLPLLHRRIMHVPTMTRAWAQFTFATVIFLPWIGFSNWNLDAGDWWRLLVLGVVCTVIGHSLWVKVSSEMPAVFVAVIYYFYVPIAMAGSYLFLNEDITLTMTLGASCIIAANVGTAITTWRRSRRPVSGN